MIALLVQAGDDAAAAGHGTLAVLLIVRLARGLLLRREGLENAERFFGLALGVEREGVSGDVGRILRIFLVNFPRDFLADFGFQTVRVRGRVELARLELGGLLPVVEGTRERVLRVVREAFVPAPAPTRP